MDLVGEQAPQGWSRQSLGIQAGATSGSGQDQLKGEESRKTFLAKTNAMTGTPPKGKVAKDATFSPLSIFIAKDQRKGRLFYAQALSNAMRFSSGQGPPIEGHVFRDGRVAMFFHSGKPELHAAVEEAAKKCLS